MRFPKSERLCNKKIIEQLFKEGSNEFVYPLKVFYLKFPSPSETPPQTLFSIPKKNFKKAVDRNRMKRKIREIYRLHKSSLKNEAGFYKIAYLAFVYIAKEKMSFGDLEKKILQLFKRFMQ